MKLTTIRELLQCEVLTGEDRLELDVDTAVASDAMSIVLATPHPQALMITGLTHVQSVRTANVAGLAAIVYVRGDRPNGQAVDFARAKGIVLLVTARGMFETCGILRDHGMQGGS